LWSDNSTQQTLHISSSGTYGVTVTGSTGCTATSSLEVYLKPVPVVNLGPDVTQCGGSVTLDAGFPGYGFQWSTNQTVQIISVSGTGPYRVTVTDPNSGCTATGSILVTIDTIPVVNLGPDVTQCGGSVTLNAANPGGTYLWSDNSTGSTLTVTNSGIYRVTVTTARGCSSADAVQVTINPIPLVTLSEPAIVCRVTPPFVLNGGSPPGGTYYVDDTITTIFQPAQLGITNHHVVYVYTNQYGCTDSASTDILVRAQPFITTIMPPAICSNSHALDLDNYFTPKGGSYSGLGVSQHYFYPPLNGSGNDTIVDIYTDDIGCKDTSVYPITILRPAHVSMVISPADFTICAGQTVTLKASGGDNYEFFLNGNSAGQPSANDSYTYSGLKNHDEISVAASNVCSADTSDPAIIDVHALPVVNAGPDTTIALGTTIQMYGSATGDGLLQYLWTPSFGLSLVNIPNPYFSGNDTTEFTLTVSDTYGCADSDHITVFVYVPDEIELPNTITPDGDGKNDMWKLNPKLNLDGSHLVIFNRWGETVYETSNYANNWDGTYKGTGRRLPDGTYYYVLKVPSEHDHVYRGAINILNSDLK
jgi:gliding motility-associated-like protein